ncbi:MAG: hypothetical protein ACTSWX_00920 [Promethearchaeota archaeon]
MAVFIKRKKILALEENRSEIDYLYNSFSEELKKIILELKNIDYQINFFGVTDELLEEKKEIIVLINWLKEEIEDLSKFRLKNH